MKTAKLSAAVRPHFKSVIIFLSLREGLRLENGAEAFRFPDFSHYLKLCCRGSNSLNLSLLFTYFQILEWVVCCESNLARLHLAGSVLM